MRYAGPDQPRTGAGLRTAAGRAAAVAGGTLWALVIATMLGACASTRDGEGAPAPKAASVNRLEARMVPIGDSATKGTVRFAPSGNGLAASVYLSGGAGDYRMVIHATGNCSSPNGFSAGPPWLPPGATEPIVVRFSFNSDNTASVEQRVPGLSLDGPAGIAGHSVVIHAGSTGSLDAQPDRPNNRVACAVIGPVAHLFNLF